jgi:hypothetical protein
VAVTLLATGCDEIVEPAIVPRKSCKYPRYPRAAKRVRAVRDPNPNPNPGSCLSLEAGVVEYRIPDEKRQEGNSWMWRAGDLYCWLRLAEQGQCFHPPGSACKAGD